MSYPNYTIPSTVKSAYYNITISKLDQMEDYSEKVEQFLTDNKATFETDLNDIVQQYPEKERSTLYEFFEYDLIQNQKIYPNILRYAIFVSLYSILEYQLDQLCKLFKNHNDFALSLGDIKGKGIFRAQKYLKKVALINFPDNNNSWVEINYYNRIRNCIVHKEGYLLEDENSPFYRYIQNHNFINLDQENKIEITRLFVHEAIDNLKLFFNELNMQINIS